MKFIMVQHFLRFELHRHGRLMHIRLLRHPSGEKLQTASCKVATVNFPSGPEFLV
jgi:hypothetical protein